MKSMRDPKRKPTHPGEILRLDVLPAQERALTGRPLAETVLRLPLKPGAGAAPCDVEAVHDRELPAD